MSDPATPPPPSDPVAPLPPSDPVAPPPAGKPRVGLLRAALLPLGLIAAAGAAFGVVYLQNPAPPPVASASFLKGYLADQGRYSTLAAGYTDADGDLVADAPADPAKFLKPDELLFTVVGTDDPVKAEAIWRPFLDHVQKTTGVKKVSYLKELAPPAPTPPPTDDAEPAPPPVGGTVEQQLDALKAGKLHVTAFNTGFVPAAVNAAGFVPLFCPADAAGKYTYETEILVPAGSPAQSPADLKGQTFAFSAMSSNSGAKTPLVALKQQFNMLPGRDYDVVFSGTQDRSIDGVAAGRYAAAPVANDLLRQRVEGGKVAADKFRSVYKSGPFPPLTFGVGQALDPALRAAVEKAFESFPFAGTTVGAYYAPSGRVKFVRVDYKKDFGYVREIDEKLVTLLDGK